ncbi:MAG TPA: hypothetical protein VJK05_03640 [archaeon]|nr:hypothetical protein [archaeon]
MNKNDFVKALKEVRNKAKERKFKQSVDLTINFKELDFKKPDSSFSLDVALPFSVGGKTESKTLVFARDKGFAADLKGKVDKIVMEDEISKISKKDAEGLAVQFDVFLAEGPVMLTVAKFLGQTLAPKGKMPKPVAMSVDNVLELKKKGASNTKVTNKKQKVQPLVHLKIGSQDFKDEDLAENAFTVYRLVEDKLPNKNHNIKSVYVKMTMSAPVKVGESK